MSDYTRYSFAELLELDAFEYWALRRDAVIYKYMQSGEGLDYLERCWILEQTTPDRNKLRSQFGKEG